MNNVALLINEHGGLEALKERPIKILNGHFMPLCIEWIGSGPGGKDAISVAHYGEQNGDLMRDPEMCFTVDVEDDQVLPDWTPYYFRNDYRGIEQDAELAGAKSRALAAGMVELADLWNENILHQGFIDCFRESRARKVST